MATPSKKPLPSAADRQKPRVFGWNLAWAAALLAGVTLVAYLPVLRAGFVWDDDTFLTQNPLIKAADGLRRFWATTDATDYWPMTSTTLWVEWRLWGMQATGYHATNLLLHVAECLLLWRILVLLRVPGAFLAALVFAVHPVNVESVAWIAERKNLVAMLFFLGSVLFFVKKETASPAQTPGLGEGGRAWYWLSLASFVLAMLSKGSVAMLPLVLMGLVAWRRKIGARDLLQLLPFFIVAAVLAAVDVWFQEHGGTEVIQNAGVLQRLLGAGGVVWFYLYKAVWPVKLIFVYPQWHVSAADWRWWAPLLSAIAVTVLLSRKALAKRDEGGLRSPLLAAWLFFCVMLVPVMGLTSVYFMKYSLVADHYQHLALIGVVALAGSAWARWNFKGAAAVAAVAVGALACLTWRQCLNYRDAETLYRATIASDPSSWMAHNNLGRILSGRPGKQDEAIAHFEAALRARPDLVEVHNNLGAVWLKMPGRLNDAIGQLEEALRLNPEYAGAHNNMGFALAKSPGRLNDAIAQYREALRLKPGYAEAHSNLANALAMVPGRTNEAIAEYEEALRLNPGLAEAHNNLGYALAAIPGRLNEAIAQYEEALRLNPDYAEAHNNLGFALATTPGRLNDAAAQFEQALRLTPDDAEAHYNLGNVLSTIPSRLNDAIAEYGQALRLNPDNAGAHNNLANVLARIPGGLNDAITQYEQALRLKPDYAEAHYNLANALAADPARIPQAITHFEEALRFKPDSPDIHNNLANALAKIPGRLNEAVDHYGQALRLNPDYVAAHCNLAEAYAEMGRLDDAIAQLELALKLDPSLAGMRENLNRLRAAAGR
jgi:tetratricopeptide (TPR) repeat protein